MCNTEVKGDTTEDATLESIPEDTVQDSGSDFQFEKDDFNSTDSEFDDKEQKALCKKPDPKRFATT